MRLRTLLSFVVSLFATFSMCQLQAAPPGVDALPPTEGPPGGVAKFGDLNQDLVYTPVTPCRLVDTRSTAAGSIAAGATRSFVALNSSSFTGQGGSSTNCGTLGISATVIMIVATAVTPTAPGAATVFTFGTAQPAAASMQYAAGAIDLNTLAVKIPNPFSSFDFTVHTTAQSHFVFDIVGYFAPPLATALQCQDTADNIFSDIKPNGSANVTAPACPAGYTQTATNCESSDWLVPFVFIHSGVCSARNNSASVQQIRASRTCCRVPGR